MSSTWYAPAKINLWLRVFAGDASGYHPLDTLFCAIDLCDRLDITDADGIHLDVTGADVGPAESNLAYRAAHEYFLTLGRPPRISMKLHKNIPAGAGLGGGSSDAATVLRALQQLHDDALPQADLLALAARLGSDVPFFLCGSPLARARGRGERLDPLPPLTARTVLLVIPDFAIATRDAYRWLDGSGTLQPHGEPWPAPRNWPEVERRATNTFESVLFARYPLLREVCGELTRAGATMARVSGSGSAVFGVFAAATDALAAQRVLAVNPLLRCHLTRTRTGETDWTETGSSR
jgi:4-diphosphocytidyl-2-C-methyl-D-erythritol kinase